MLQLCIKSSDFLFILSLFTPDVQTSIVSLDFRVTVLEVNGNQTFTLLEVKVETLERTAADHETKISAIEIDINAMIFWIINYYFSVLCGSADALTKFNKTFNSDLEGDTSDHETRLTVAEENIQSKRLNTDRSKLSQTLSCKI